MTSDKLAITDIWPLGMRMQCALSLCLSLQRLRDDRFACHSTLGMDNAQSVQTSARQPCAKKQTLVLAPSQWHHPWGGPDPDSVASNCREMPRAWNCSRGLSPAPMRHFDHTPQRSVASMSTQGSFRSHADRGHIGFATRRAAFGGTLQRRLQQGIAPQLQNYQRRTLGPAESSRWRPRVPPQIACAA